jgi:hypothetical protein
LRLFAQLSWYFRRDPHPHLLRGVMLLRHAVDHNAHHLRRNKLQDGNNAVMVYLLRYVWRVLLFGASYQLAVELREDFYRQLTSPAANTTRSTSLVARAIRSPVRWRK